MNQQIYHGNLTPANLSRSLTAHFSRGNYQVRKFGNADETVIQISTVARPSSGGQTSLNITIQAVEDGVMVTVGKQAVLGVAASLGVSALAAIRNPLSLLGRLDDIAQDIESLQLSDDIWQVIESTVKDSAPVLNYQTTCAVSNVPIAPQQTPSANLPASCAALLWEISNPLLAGIAALSSPKAQPFAQIAKIRNDSGLHKPRERFMKLHNAMTDIPGIIVGHAQNDQALTGCTVIICPEGTTGGVDQRGGAPGTRETDLLRPMHLVNHVDAILLGGGFSLWPGRSQRRHAISRRTWSRG